MKITVVLTPASRSDGRIANLVETELRPPDESVAGIAPQFVESARLGRCLSQLADEQQEIDRRTTERLAELRRLQDRD